MTPRIVYEDDAIIVVYKPAGLATQTAKVGQPDLVSWLKKYCKNSYLGVVHRLDQPVEGLLAFGKNQKAAAALTKQLSRGALNKQYFAVVCGKPAMKRAELVDYMIKTKDNMARIVGSPYSEVSDNKESGSEESGKGTADAKKAVLQYKILEDVSTPVTLALADIHIDTGRFHQIRCQMAGAGMPLLGDVKYGTGATCELSRKLGIRNVALCAYKLVLQHPVTGRKLSFEVKPENKAFDFFLENNFGCDCLY